MIPEALFERVGACFLPTDLSRGPWDPRALHGGPTAALLGRAVELHEGGGMFVARMTVELLRPVPVEPLSLSVRTMRPGKKVQLIEAALRTDAHEVARATGLRIRQTQLTLPEDMPEDAERMAPVEAGKPQGEDTGHFHAGFHNRGTEHRFVRGHFLEIGPSADWIRLAVPLLADEEPSPLCRVLAAADFGNGISGVLGPAYTYINPDLTVHLHRYPRGEWVGLSAHSRIEPIGVGLAESRLFDRDGPIGRSLQSLIVEARG